MSMMKLAMQNFKNSFKNYAALIASLSFTILIFLNFQYLVYSDAFKMLGEKNQDYINLIIESISVVLGCFMFFFIWYSTNVFLTKRKKEIGIYVFMGLTNQKIGKLYMLESMMTGLSALVFGVGFGMLLTQLFQMILLAISDITVEIKFHFILKPVLITTGVYLLIYFIFVIKGYISIVRSSVLEMISATRKNEYVKQKSRVLTGKTMIGLAVLFTGYFYAVKDGGVEILTNGLIAVVLVIIGVYLLFGGLLPLIFQQLEKHKGFLYKKQRTLWVNNVIFRMKRNYRTYAMTCVLMLCSVSALAAGFAMKLRYENIVHFRNTYTFQLISSLPDLNEKAAELIEKDNDIAFDSQITMLQLDSSLFDTPYKSSQYALLAYSQLKQLAADTGLEFDLKEPGTDQLIDMESLPLISLITESAKDVTVGINGKTYNQTAETSVPYLGYLQTGMSFYVVNDQVYNELSSLGQQCYVYNYRIKDIYNYEASKDELDTIVVNTDENYVGRVAIDPEDKENEWIKVMYSVCVFMFLVFILASGSILFMKLYNDAFEEKERYAVLKKLGIAQKTLRKSIARELLTAYALPFLVMSISSCFSVYALGRVMKTDVWEVNVVSVLVIFVFFLICYAASVSVYRKNVGVKR
jgi:putative ABC transport system permease protein